LLIFCLVDLSMGDNGICMSPTITVLGSICALKSITAFIVVGCPYVLYIC
jgi:hypothetical protein